jgi:hypothetical protein
MSRSNELIVTLREERPDATFEELMDFLTDEFLDIPRAEDERQNVWIDAIGLLKRIQNKKSPLIIQSVIDQVVGKDIAEGVWGTEVTNGQSIMEMVDLLILEVFDQQAISDACEKAECNDNEITWVIQNKRDLLQQMCEVEAKHQLSFYGEPKILKS